MTTEWLHTAAGLTGTGWTHGWSDYNGPDFHHPADTPAQITAVDSLVAAVGLTGAAWATQVHGPTVSYVGGSGWSGEADALWTDVPGLGVVGRSADCPLILVGGQRPDGRPVWGFAHASWRSTLQHITLNLVRALTAAGARRTTLQAVICPSAGPCCYEVGPEVRDQALAALGPEAREFFATLGDRFILDLWADNSKLAAWPPSASTFRAFVPSAANRPGPVTDGKVTPQAALPPSSATPHPTTLIFRRISRNRPPLLAITCDLYIQVHCCHRFF